MSAFLTRSAGELLVEGRPLVEMADELGTPFFLVSEPQLARNVDDLRAGLASAGLDVELRYCAKTSFEAEVLRSLAGLGCSALASHVAEARLCMACGFAPDRLTLQRPVLDAGDVRAALAAGVRHLHVYRPEDAEAFAAVAAEEAVDVRVSLRVRPPSSVLAPLRALSRRLGLAEEEVLPTARRVVESSRLELVGLNVHGGTQRASPARVLAPLPRLVRAAEALRRELDVTVAELNLGGGVPSPTLRRVGMSSLPARWLDARGEEPASDALRTFAADVGDGFREAVGRLGWDRAPSLVLEPGRALVGNAVLLVTRVRRVREHWAFVDASRNVLDESLLVAWRRIELARAGGGEKTWSLAGGSLNTMDVLDVRRRLPHLEVGDVLAFRDAGAYTISRANRYASLVPAVHVLRGDGSHECVRPAESADDLLGAS